MNVVVPDASVILKWALPSGDEPDACRALLLRNAIRDDLVRAIVPSLWLYEVGNTVARRFPTHAGTWLSSLVKFGLQESPVSSRWLAQVLELTASYPVSFYDAAYHATALIHGGVFVTADERYAGTAQPHGAVVNLRDWMPPREPGPRRRR
ncbi:MAG: type II toxin-antitoxin system VapC family toxin [Steroidobacteraceae bacterium]|nr:type II toxin-antitoxin system VapC family toxin [Steroidobacteraceae bacterium]MBP7012922.1 type II toxin-antitoxin system VapC family toxin [Steroidobacteraceae bacterium]